MGLVETARFPSAIATETDMLNWKNLIAGQTNPTLQNSIASTDTTALLATGTGAELPTDNFCVTIDSEILFVTSRAGDTLNIGTRGYEGTAAAAHSAGVTVLQMVTAKSHNQIVSEVNAIEYQLGANLANVVKTSQIGAANGVAALDATGAIKTTSLPATLEYNTNKGAASGYAPLDANSQVPLANMNGAVELNTNKGQPNGYAGLDSSGNISIDQLPPSHALLLITVNTIVNAAFDRGTVVKATGGTAGITITLPDAGIVQTNEVVFLKVDNGAGTVTITTQFTQTINGKSTYQLVNQWQLVRLLSDGTNWIVIGNN